MEKERSYLQVRIDALVTQHGSLRAAARVLQVSPGYLGRLQSGEKTEPSEKLLRRMQLRRLVRYVPYEPVVPLRRGP